MGYHYTADVGPLETPESVTLSSGCSVRILDEEVIPDQILATELDSRVVVEGVVPLAHTTRGDAGGIAARERVAGDHTGGTRVTRKTRALFREHALGPFFEWFFEQVIYLTIETGDPVATRWLIVHHPTYSGSRKLELLKTLEELESRGGDFRRSVKGFVKREFYPARKPPRMIAAVDENTKVWTMAAWNELNHAVFGTKEGLVKTIPYKDRPAEVMRLLERFEHVAGADSSRFESVFRRPIMRIEQAIYHKIGLSPECFKPLDGVNRIKGGYMNNRPSWRANIRAKRMSGEQNTSLGNSIMNMAFISFVLVQSGIGWSDFCIIAEGDDAIVGYNGDIDLDWFRKLGIKMDWQIADHPGNAGFCSLYFDDRGRYFVPPEKLARLGWSLTCPHSASDKVRAELLTAKLKSLSLEAPGCPLAWKFLQFHSGRGRIKRSYWAVQQLKSLGVDTGDGDYWVYTDGNIEVSEPSREDRVSYELLFGVPVALQLQIESCIDQGDMRLLAEVISDRTPDMIQGWDYVRRSVF